LDIPIAGALVYRASAMIGQLRFYDRATGWGVIVGDDGALYMLDGQRLSGPPLRLGERIRFEPATGPGGLRATGAQRLSVFTKGSPNAAR
jgi:cold shock CspA family protein